MELVACASSMAPSMLKGTIHRFKSSICLVQMICFRECFAYFSMIMLRFDAGVWYNTITSFPFPKVQQLASSVHRWLQTVVKEEGMLQSLKMALFCGVFLPSKLFFFLSFTSEWYYYLHLNIWYVFYVILWINDGLMRLENYCILLLFSFYSASQLFFGIGVVFFTRCSN